jgi:8-oxo-dGTP pyrophosphatase MutT (NUDIX family)
MKGDINNLQVVGFAFRPDLDKVVLMQKARPDWQAGQLNGVGGRVKQGEEGVPAVAMQREFLEETGCVTSSFMWDRSQTITFPNDVMLFVYHTVLTDLHSVRSLTDETVLVLPVEYVLKLPPHPILDIQGKIRLALHNIKLKRDMQDL